MPLHPPGLTPCTLKETESAAPAYTKVVKTKESNGRLFTLGRNIRTICRCIKPHDYLIFITDPFVLFPFFCNHSRNQKCEESHLNHPFVMLQFWNVNSLSNIIKERIVNEKGILILIVSGRYYYCMVN
jgi:hypothetical protein